MFKSVFAVRFSLFVLLGLLLTSLTACVPYPRFQEAEKKLNIANRVNRDLENRLKSAGVELAASMGGDNMQRVTFDALNTQLESLQIENETLNDQLALLQDQIRNIPEMPMGDSGFDSEDVDNMGGATKLVDGEIIMDSDLLFSSGKAALVPGAKKALDMLANVIKDKYSTRIIHLSGHTDNKPLVKSKHIHKDNWNLAHKRAHSVFSYLVERGVPEVQMRIHSFGYAKPFGNANPNTDEGRSQSRRVEIILGGTASG